MADDATLGPSLRKFISFHSELNTRVISELNTSRPDNEKKIKKTYFLLCRLIFRGRVWRSRTPAVTGDMTSSV